MEPHYEDDTVTLHHGDCLEVMADMPDASVDSIVTDPPYGLGFMGREWDSLPPGLPWARECLRVLKPGGHLLAFGGTRTWHRLACAVEDAGFEVRDSIAWLYGSGFPKSLDVSKAITATQTLGGSSRTLNRRAMTGDESRSESFGSGPQTATTTATSRPPERANLTPDAQQWAGWGTALKPAFEPVVVARKPLAGTVAANVLEHGTGALNVDACRVGRGEGDRTEYGRDRHLPHANTTASLGKFAEVTPYNPHDAGRWPTNVVLDDTQAAVLDEQSGELHTQDPATRRGTSQVRGVTEFSAGNAPCYDDAPGTGASRFFPTFQSDPCDVCGEDMSGWHRDGRDEHVLAHVGESLPTFRYEAKAPASERPKVNGTAHPTVKPLDLMRWLVRLVTPPGGTVLEPFAGSGTTVEACVIEGFKCVAIEKTDEYLPLITQRINRQRDPVAYMHAAGDDLGLFDLT